MHSVIRFDFALRKIEWKRLARSLTVAAIFPLAACGSTEKELLKAQISAYDSAIVLSNSTLSTLQGGNAPGTYEARLFISKKTVNEALESLAGQSFEISGIPGATAKLDLVSLSNLGSSPAVQLDCTAVKGNLSIKVAALAILQPIDGQPGALKLQILYFIPDVKWGPLDFTKITFIKALLAVRVIDITNQLPAIQLPIGAALVLGGAANQIPVTVSAGDSAHLNLSVNQASTLWTPSLRNVRYYFIKGGIYIFGDVQ